MDLRLLVFLTGILAVFYFLLIRPQFTVRTELRRWAEANGLVLTRAERRLLAQGPFMRMRSGVVFKIEIQRPNGERRTGWIRLAYDSFRRERWSKRVVWDDDESTDG